MSNAAISASQAAINSAQVAINLAGEEVAEAARQRCVELMAAYTPAGASVDQMREYARCVYRLHGSGEPLSEPDILALKILIVLALAGFLVGVVKGWKDDGFGGAVMEGLLGGIAAPGLAFLAWLAVGGVAFVLGGEFRSFL